MSAVTLVVLLGLSSCIDAAAIPAKRFLPNGEESRVVPEIPGQSPVAEGKEAPSAAGELSVKANIDQEGPMVLPGGQQGVGQSDLDAVGEGAAEANEALASDKNMEQDVPMEPGVEKTVSTVDNEESYSDDTIEYHDEDELEEQEVDKPIAGEKPLDQGPHEEADNPTAPLPAGGSGIDLTAIRAGLKCALFKDCSEMMDDVEDGRGELSPTSILRKTHRR